jgi:hypothetical protein
LRQAKSPVLIAIGKEKWLGTWDQQETEVPREVASHKADLFTIPITKKSGTHRRMCNPSKLVCTLDRAIMGSASI